VRGNLRVTEALQQILLLLHHGHRGGDQEGSTAGCAWGIAVYTFEGGIPEGGRPLMGVKLLCRIGVVLRHPGKFP